LSQTCWRILPRVPLRTDLPGIHPLIVQLLYNRGITEPAQFEAFLNVDRRLEADPFLLPDMHRAVQRTYQALFRGERIAVYGDFDADGITATALLTQGLSALGGRVIPFIPHRFRDGYGLQLAPLERLGKAGVSLIITADTGISAFEEVARCRKLGMDVIVTDHHVPPDYLPPALAVVDPKRSDSAFRATDLAGVGVAFKLLQALLEGSGRDRVLAGLLDLVALGTVADMVPLLGDNRYWVKQGLELLNSTERIGLQEMMRCAGLQPGNLTSESISWILAPRINAAGRLDDASTSYRLLVTQSRDEAARLALDLEEKNARRQRMTSELLLRARELLLAQGVDFPLLMVGGADFPAGVMGLVAGRLAEEFYRPVILLKTGPEVCRGSGRSIPEFNLIGALDRCRDLLLNVGGHAGAAGFTVQRDNLAALQMRLLKIAEEELAGVDLRPHIDIDAEVPLTVFTGDFYQQLQKLAPFGSGNPEPTFVTREVEVLEWSPVGEQGDHLRLKVRQESVVWDAIGFGLGGLADQISSRIDVAYNLIADAWSGVERLRLKLLDFDPVD
jgi:single-stranded-DNA-specific exonuclease